MRSLFSLLLWASLTALCVLVGLRCNSLCPAAPAPLPRRGRVLIIPPEARWAGTWTSNRWPGWIMHLLPGGQYLAEHPSATWYIGTWRINGDGIEVGERLIGTQGFTCTYQFTRDELTRTVGNGNSK